MRRISGILALVVGAIAAFFLYIGYLDGPLFVPVPATSAAPPNRARLAAVLLSGDMGFRIGMASRIAQRLASDGIPVLGVNTLYYFRGTRTPAEAEALVAAAMRRALALNHADRIVLIGQSFGADMLHTGLASLPLVLRSKVVLVSLIVPDDTVQYRASPTEVFSFMDQQHPALVTASKLSWVPGLCIYGVRQETSLCPELTLPHFESVGLAGGHPLNRDADAVHAKLIAAIDAVTKN